jgi:two-component system chemotaxis sensor kinase CheA
LALEERIIQLRMVSLERVLQRAVRAGRVAAKVSGKEVEFRAVGGSLRIDKMLCDAIADPLLHLVRNAVDQGIETSDERAKNGKSMKGSVRIEVSSTGGLVRVLVSDDGRGIDPQLISQAAAKLGLVDEGTVLSRDMSLRMIFRPGFSTTANVSTVSGRGVGLDIVESSIERVGGAVRVRTELGRGTESSGL